MNFEYRPFSNEDLCFVTPLLYKREPNKIFSPTEENTITILLENQIVAFIDWSYYREQNIYSIDLFEVFNPGNGIGTEIIRYIQQCDKVTCIQINPYSSRSIRFWRKMGFQFMDDDTMQWQKGQINEIT